MEEIKLEFSTIGYIRSPYINSAPNQPSYDETEAMGKFYVEIKEKYQAGLKELDKFKYIYLLYYLNRRSPFSEREDLLVIPPWGSGKRVGLFASRSPHRINPLGLSVVKIMKIEKNRVYTTPLDAFDKTPLLDIKPYIRDLDSHPDSNYGWLSDEKDWEHLLLHIKGIPH